MSDFEVRASSPDYLDIESLVADGQNIIYLGFI